MGLINQLITEGHHPVSSCAMGETLSTMVENPSVNSWDHPVSKKFSPEVISHRKSVHVVFKDLAVEAGPWKKPFPHGHLDQLFRLSLGSKVGKLVTIHIHPLSILGYPFPITPKWLLSGELRRTKKFARTLLWIETSDFSLLEPIFGTLCWTIHDTQICLQRSQERNAQINPRSHKWYCTSTHLA